MLFSEQDLLVKSEIKLNDLEEIKEKDDKSEETSLYVPSDENKLHDTETEPNYSSKHNLALYVDKLDEINTIFFTDDNGNIHALDIQKYILDFQLEPGKDQTKKSNYFPYRTVNMQSNGMFSCKEELLSGFQDERSSSFAVENLQNVSRVYHNEWNAFEDALTLFSLISIPKKLLVVASGYTYYKIYSVFGELL